MQLNHVLAALYAASAAHACIKVEGRASTGLDVIINGKLTDGGKEVCHGNCQGRSDVCEFKCNKGYSLKATFNAPAKPLQFHYKTPKGVHNFKSDAPTCVYDSSCCGGSPEAPCSCAACAYRGQALCK